MNILMPMAGEGSRTKGISSLPKPLIDIANEPMFHHAAKSASHLGANYIFVVREEHEIEPIVFKLYPTAKVVIQKGKVNGAVYSALLAKEYIDDSPLLIMDCDMAIRFNYWELFKIASDAGVVTFKSEKQAYSYVTADSSNRVLSITEKSVIGDSAVAGSYFWKNGKEFVTLAERVTERDSGSELYMSKVISEALLSGMLVRRHTAEKAYDLSTEQGIKEYLDAGY